MYKILESSAENMEQLRAPVALPEGSGSSLSSHMLHNMVCHSTSRGTAPLSELCQVTDVNGSGTPTHIK